MIRTEQIDRHIAFLEKQRAEVDTDAGERASPIWRGDRTASRPAKRWPGISENTYRRIAELEQLARCKFAAFLGAVIA